MKGQFSRLVWELATSIPEGRVTTYGILARAAGGGRQAARSVTSILTKAPNSRAIPFHRIVYADGHAWLDARCAKERKALYKREDIKLDAKGKIKNFEEILYYFD